MSGKNFTTNFYEFWTIRSVFSFFLFWFETFPFDWKFSPSTRTVFLSRCENDRINSKVSYPITFSFVFSLYSDFLLILFSSRIINLIFIKNYFNRYRFQILYKDEKLNNSNFFIRKDKLATNSCDISYEKKIIFKLFPIFLNHYYTYYYYYYYFGKTLIQFFQKSIKNKRSFKTCHLNKTRTKKWKNQKVITLIQITPITVSKSITSHLKLPPIPPPHLIRPNKTRTNKQTNQPSLLQQKFKHQSKFPSSGSPPLPPL